MASVFEISLSDSQMILCQQALSHVGSIDKQDAHQPASSPVKPDVKAQPNSEDLPKVQQKATGTWSSWAQSFFAADEDAAGGCLARGGGHVSQAICQPVSFLPSIPSPHD
jgi:hypothetical protein